MGTLRIIPHPEENKRMYLTKEPSQDGKRPKGTRMFRFLVKGTPEELEKFKAGMGQYYLEETDPDSPHYGQPIMNSQEQITGPRAVLFTREGRPFIKEDQAVVNFDGAVKKFGTALKSAERLGAGVIAQMEKGIAEMLLSSINTPAAVSTTESFRRDDQPETPTQEKLDKVIDENAGVKTDAPVTKLEEELDEQ